MAKNPSIKFKIKLDERAAAYFQSFPERMSEARENALEAAGMAWADGAKDITRAEDHVVSSLYINSIGYNTGSPATKADTINEYIDRGDRGVLKIGSNVEYAAALEKRYNIFARAIDTSQARMNKVAKAQITKVLRG